MRGRLSAAQARRRSRRPPGLAPTRGGEPEQRAPRGTSTRARASALQTCDQRPLGGQADGADRGAASKGRSAAAARAERPGRPPRRRAPRRGRAGSGRWLAEHRADHERDRAANDEEEGDGAERGAATQPEPHRDQRDARGDHDQHRVEHAAGTAGRRSRTRPGRSRGRSAGRRPSRSGAAATSQSSRRSSPRAPWSAAAAAALHLQHRDPDQRHDGAADQHQVGRAPEGHVLPEQPVPAVVEREPDQRERARRRRSGRRPAARASRGRSAPRSADRLAAGAPSAMKPALKIPKRPARIR